MAVRRISQLDLLDDNNYLIKTPDGVSGLKDGGNVLSGYLFETSELKDEETQHYLSKKMTGLDLSAFLLTDITNILFQLSAEITNKLNQSNQITS